MRTGADEDYLLIFDFVYEQPIIPKMTLPTTFVFSRKLVWTKSMCKPTLFLKKEHGCYQSFNILASAFYATNILIELRFRDMSSHISKRAHVSSEILKSIECYQILPLLRIAYRLAGLCVWNIEREGYALIAHDTPIKHIDRF